MYRMTKIACYMTSVTMSVTNIFSSLLFVTFIATLGLSITQISILIALNFLIQIFVDIICSAIVDKIGYRICIMTSLSLSLAGLILLGTLPFLLENKFLSLIIPTVTWAIGSGIGEVVTSPIIEAIPEDGSKAKNMALLHSCYCFGSAIAIAVSTLYFAFLGIENWRYLCYGWTLLPLCALILFSFSPICQLKSEGVRGDYKALFKSKLFWLLLIVMLGAGAAEISMAQWASLFAESALGISKATGDLLGPCAFALLQGGGRILMSIYGDRIRLDRWIGASFALCFIAYVTAALSSNPVICLIACALCGLGCSILWPGTLNVGSKHLQCAGTIMFALFAFAGDIGCTVGPDIIGFVSDAVSQGKLSILHNIINGDSLTVGMKSGMLVMSLIPLLSLICSLIVSRIITKKESK